MSDKKKVIYVKDLVIKADNVTIEPQKSGRPYDPFFGPVRRGDVEGVEDVKDDRDVDDVVDESSDDKKDDDERRPFSWI